jgi:hypothetical protein
MKRYLFVAFCLLSLACVQAQTFNYSGLEIKQEKVKKKNVYEWEQFVLANYNFGIMGNGNGTKAHSFGLTYGCVKLFGVYVNATISTGMHYRYSHQTDWEGKINGVYPFYTGKSSFNRASMTTGCIVRMVIPFYLFIGVGYGYQSITKQISNGDWVLYDAGSYSDHSMIHSMVWDVGLQGNIKGFTIAAGYSSMTDYQDGVLHELKVSLGYTFKMK